MKKKIIISLAIVLAFAGLIYLIIKSNHDDIETADVIFPASAENGNIDEKIIGDPETASVIVYEYADFGCSHCAEWNHKLNELMQEHYGQIALVFRNYDLGFKNGPAAARAATAAHLQGYFKEYKDLLFDNQIEWYYEDTSNLEDIFVDYFLRASNDAGDVDKFKEDYKSDAVKKHLKFETKLGKKVDLKGTPLFRIDGEKIELSDLIKTIESKL